MKNQTNNTKQIGRLAMRQEGGHWNAYYALNETMDNAVFIGSIQIAAAMRSPERKKAFMDMMRDIVADILEEETGTRPTWGGVETAPEHEKAGNA